MTTTTTTATARDARGLIIRVGDRVRVTSYGWAIRSSDVGLVAGVVSITARGLVTLALPFGDGPVIANGKNVHGECLHILDRTDSSSSATEAQRLTRLAQDYGLTEVGVPSAEILERAAELELVRGDNAVLRACEACNAEPGETCRPGCIGEAAELDAEDVCSVEGCSESLLDNEGYDGLCGIHADEKEEEYDHSRAKEDARNELLEEWAREQGVQALPAGTSGHLGGDVYVCDAHDRRVRVRAVLGSPDGARLEHLIGGDLCGVYVPADAEEAAKAAHLARFYSSWCGCEAHKALYAEEQKAAELERLQAAREAEQEGREAAAQAAVVVRSQLLSQPLLSDHLRAALEILCGYAEEA